MKQLSSSLAALAVGGRADVSVSGEVATGVKVAAIGGGVGGISALNSAGSLGALGAAAVPVGTAIAAGFVGAGSLGYEVGTLIYDNSETVRGVAAEMVDRVVNQGVAGSVMQGIREIGAMVDGPGSSIGDGRSVGVDSGVTAYDGDPGYGNVGGGGWGGGQGGGGFGSAIGGGGGDDEMPKAMK